MGRPDRIGRGPDGVVQLHFLAGVAGPLHGRGRREATELGRDLADPPYRVKRVGMVLNAKQPAGRGMDDASERGRSCLERGFGILRLMGNRVAYCGIPFEGRFFTAQRGLKRRPCNMLSDAISRFQRIMPKKKGLAPQYSRARCRKRRRSRWGHDCWRIRGAALTD